MTHPRPYCAALVAQHRRWLQAAGATVRDDVQVEIHPFFALSANELAQRIDAGVRVDVDTYFQ